ncbi:MAG: hypothetical protein [Caudoviricetes sp.]|nr:MAG: hypothetical protein [Caudoviricetes sp.]
MIEEFKKNNIILLNNNSVLTITNENTIFRKWNIVISNGVLPYTLLYIFNISRDYIKDIINIYQSCDIETEALKNTIEFLDLKIIGNVIKYNGKHYIISKDLNHGYQLINVDNKNDIVNITDKELMEENLKNSNNLSYFTKEAEIITEVINKNVKDNTESAIIDEPIEQQNNEIKKEDMQENREQIFEDTVVSNILEESSNYETYSPSKKPTLTYQEKEKIYMDDIIDKCKTAADIINCNNGDKIFENTIEFFKTLSPKDKITWSRDLRMKMDLILTDSDENLDEEKNKEICDSIISTISNNYYMIRK